MRFATLLFRNLTYHARAHLAVGLGVAVGTAVLTGALLVGDSLRGSLRALTLGRLGRIDHALVADRFFRADLADRLQAVPAEWEVVVPAILLRGVVVRRGGRDQVVARAPRVQVVGVDARFWPLFGGPGGDPGDQVWPNRALADALAAREGDFLEVRLDQPSAIPADAPLGRPRDPEGLVLESSPVGRVLPEEGAGRFSLAPTQETPLILYVQLRRLQARLRGSVHEPAAANALFVATRPDVDAAAVPGHLDQVLHATAALEDLGLTLRPDQTRGRYLALESRRLLLDPVVVQALTRSPRVLHHWQSRPTITYLANQIRPAEPFPNAGLVPLLQPVAAGWPALGAVLGEGARFVPYSTVTGLDPSEPPPWGPFTLADGRPAPALQDDEILLNEWAADQIWPGGTWRFAVGRPAVTLTYFQEGDGYLLPEAAHPFTLAGVVALRDAARDRTLTPDLPGTRDSLRDWKPPFPREQWHPEWVRDADEAYWRTYRATPKAFVNPATAERLFSSRFGKYTAFRLAPTEVTWALNPELLGDLPAGRVDNEEALRPPLVALARTVAGLDEAAAAAAVGRVVPTANAGERQRLAAGLKAGWDPVLALFELVVRRRLRAALPPAALGLQFQPVKARGLATGGTAEMFGGLFLSFSFFLIASAGLLIGLLFRLGVERRARELGLLFASGFPVRRVRRLLLAEGAVAAVLGAAAGVALAVGYAALLIRLLNTWWAGPLRLSFLELHVEPAGPIPGLPYPSLVIGFALGCGLGLGTVAWAVRLLGRLRPLDLIAGRMAEGGGVGDRPARWAPWVCGLGVLAAAALAAASGAVPENEAPPLFFGSGAAVLTAALAGLGWWMRGWHGRAVAGHGPAAIRRLGAANARRHPGRSLLTAGVLASATFLVIAVEAFRQRPGAGDDRASGTGGFALYAETDVPMFPAPVTRAARIALYPPASGLVQPLRVESVLSGTTFYGCRVKPGDDVSCLNLYQPLQPRILGVPPELIRRGGFAFGALWQPTAEERANPWRLLERTDRPEVPVLADDHAAEWVLKKQVGDSWTITDENGRPVTLRLVGVLAGSLFQSEVLMAEEHFRRLFPSRGGYGFFLIDAPNHNLTMIKSGLEMVFGDRYGLVVGRPAERLAAYQAVENTYLSTFQVLGGLGVLLGTLGLAVVLLRNVNERRGELALFRALGYPRRALGELVLAENGFLVLAGLAAGTAAALVAVAPHLWGRGGAFPVLGLLGLGALVLAVGLAAGGLAVWAALRVPLLPALRKD